MLPAPQQPAAQAAIEQPAVVEHPQQRLLGVTGHGDGVETGLALTIVVHLIEQGVGQALGDKIGDNQHIRLGKGGIIELGQCLLEAGHQIGTAVKTHG